MDVPNLPSCIIGCPSERTFQGSAGTRVKPKVKKETRTMAKIVKHHGADECLWIPYEDEGPHNGIQS